MKPFTTIAVLIFAVICVGHLVRVFTGWPIKINAIDIPTWVSVIGAVVAGLMAVMLWRENKR